MAAPRINLPKNQLQQRARTVDPVDRDLSRVLTALNIASTAYGISGKIDAADLQERKMEHVEAQTALAERELEIKPTAEEAKASREAKDLGDLQKAQTEQTKSQLEISKKTQDIELGNLDKKQRKFALEREAIRMKKIREGGRGVTDFGKEMNTEQLRSQSNLEGAIHGVDNMKRLSPRVSHDIMDKHRAALKEIKKLPVVGEGVAAFKTLMESGEWQTLNEVDKQYLVSLFETTDAVLRDQSGAVLGAHEIASKMEQFAPQPSDTGETLEFRGGIIDSNLSRVRTKTGKNEQALTADPELKWNFRDIEKVEKMQRLKKKAEIQKSIESEEELEDDISILDKLLQGLGSAAGAGVSKRPESPADKGLKVRQKRESRREEAREVISDKGLGAVVPKKKKKKIKRVPFGKRG